uniref:Uncharacterized protein n=1 Tax=Arundo donax TaxID=35708 RepID=A0A0A8XXN3_ARUDO
MEGFQRLLTAPDLRVPSNQRVPVHQVPHWNSVEHGLRLLCVASL